MAVVVVVPVVVPVVVVVVMDKDKAWRTVLLRLTRIAEVRDRPRPRVHCCPSI